MDTLDGQTTRDLGVHHYGISCGRIPVSIPISTILNHALYALNFFQNPLGLRWYKVWSATLRVTAMVSQ